MNRKKNRLKIAPRHGEDKPRYKDYRGAHEKYAYLNEAARAPAQGTPERSAWARATMGAPEMRTRLSQIQKHRWAEFKAADVLSEPISETAEDILSHPLVGWWNRNYHWDATARARLEILCNADADLEQSAAVFGRTQKSVYYKARELKLSVPAAWNAIIPRKQSVPRIQLAYPYIIAKRDEHADILVVNDLVPKTLPDYIRADVCQSIMLALLEGKTTLDDLRKNKPQLEWFIKKFKKDAQDPNLISLEANDDGRDTYNIAASFGSVDDESERRRHFSAMTSKTHATQIEDLFSREIDAAYWNSHRIGKHRSRRELRSMAEDGILNAAKEAMWEYHSAKRRGAHVSQRLHERYGINDTPSTHIELVRQCRFGHPFQKDERGEFHMITFNQKFVLAIYDRHYDRISTVLPMPKDLERLEASL